MATVSRILLIEPDRILAETTRQALENSGFQVAVCASAQAGVLVADRLKIDIVILELQLVGHSGIEFLYEFRSYRDWQHIPAIIFSLVPPSTFSQSWALLTKELNICEYLYKPHTTLNQLVNSVSHELHLLAA